MSSLRGVDPDVLATLALDIGQQHSVYRAAPNLRLATCPKCKARVSPLELRQVSTQWVRFPHYVQCPRCGGSGGYGALGLECPRCDGRSRVLCADKECEKCHGTGNTYRSAGLACVLCCSEMRSKGTGRAPCYTRGAA